MIAAARPDAGDAAKRLVERLGEPPEQPVVTIHGDANLGNALQLADGRVALLDLEHLATGPAAADVGQVRREPARRDTPARARSSPGTARSTARRCAWYTARVAARPDRAARRQPLPAEDLLDRLARLLA